MLSLHCTYFESKILQWTDSTIRRQNPCNRKLTGKYFQKATPNTDITMPHLGNILFSLTKHFHLILSLIILITIYFSPQMDFLLINRHTVVSQSFPLNIGLLFSAHNHLRKYFLHLFCTTLLFITKSYVEKLHC